MHFHIFLNPPAPLEIAAHLLADGSPASSADSATSPATLQAEAQGLLDYTLTLIEGEELMFTMDVPYIPAQDTPIVLAQADTAVGSTPQPDYLLKVCQNTTSNVNDKTAAIRGVYPAGMLRTFFSNQRDMIIDVTKIKTTLQESTTHGKLVEHTADNGAVYYMYEPTPDYVGDDRAVFMAEFEGKRYKIVVNLKVSYVVDNYLCPDNRYELIKVKKPSTGSSGYDMGFITVTFADLAGGAVGQAVGNTITLDTNAANHNWYIDATPLTKGAQYIFRGQRGNLAQRA
ncbi:MAG: hypothetical protein HY938_03250 [Nitrosomonadales bacterium]|nr:hypothetical protein [Nitrosomonadales bacterium]